MHTRGPGGLYLGIESVRGFRQASLRRQVMYGVLLLASLPLYYLQVVAPLLLRHCSSQTVRSNSLVSTKYSA